MALAIEQRGVAAVPGLERLDVVGQLALEVFGGVRPTDAQDRPITEEKTRLLAESAVLAIQLNLRRSLGHEPIVGLGLGRPGGDQQRR